MYLLEASIRQVVKNLTQILQAYNLPWSVNDSSKSDSHYIYFTVNKKNVVFRISDHELPNISQGHAANKDADFYFDYRPNDYERAKRKLLHFLQAYSIPKLAYGKVQPWVKYRKEIYSDFIHLLKTNRTDDLTNIFHIIDFIGTAKIAQLKKWQDKTITDIIKGAEVDFPKELTPILNKYRVE
jgi:hypothetical protein